MRVGLAQINGRVGDFEGNRDRIVAAVEYAAGRGAELVVLPELATVGYPPRDLLFDAEFRDAAIRATGELAAALAGSPPVVTGAVAPASRTPPGHPGLWNVAALVHGGRVVFAQPKRLLPAYDVFVEPRWFAPGESSEPADVSGRRLGLMVCEDMWDDGYEASPGRELAAAGAGLLVCVSASPFRPSAYERRLAAARRQGAPLVFVNLVGANDEIVFDGASFALDGGGRVVARLPKFREAVEVVDIAGAPPATIDEAAVEEELFEALVLGVRDFVGKNGLRRAVLGLSGGIDSALVACVAAEALGPGRVTAVAMPSRFTDERSTACARELSARLGIGFEVVPIQPLHAEAERSLAHLVGGGGGAVAENVQARLRALVLLAYVNRFGGVLLNTSNKTELTLGYGTLHGDMAGTLGVIADLTKPQVYAVARRYDVARGVIPEFILERPPSAELEPDQVDPFDYDAVGPALEAMVQGASPGDAGVDARLAAMYRAAEHKRRQFGIGLKVSDRAFGTGRIVPVTRK